MTEAAVTETPAPTEAVTATETPAPPETPAPTATPVTQASKQASGLNVKIAGKKWYQSPFTWIAVIAALAVAGLLIYHNKKK